MALSAAIWSSLLLLLLSGTVLHLSSQHLEFARRTVAAAEARAGAESAIALGFALSQTLPDGVLPTGTIRLEHNGSRLEIVFEDEGGKADLNAAPLTLLSALFQAAGLSASDARAGLAAIEAARAVTPFSHIEEAMAIIPGADGPKARLARALTVQTGTPFVDPAVANDSVLIALYGNDRRAAGDYQRRRAQTGRMTPSSAEHTSPLLGAGFTIRGSAVLPTGYERQAQALFVPSDKSLTGHKLAAWRAY